MDEKSVLSQRLKAKRLEYEKTQREIADIVGLTPKMISFYELDQRVPPNDILWKLADYFNVTTDYLLGRSNEPSVETKKDPVTISDDGFSDIDSNLIDLLTRLSPNDAQRVRDFVAGIIATRKE